MAGHYGQARRTVQNITVVRTDVERGLILVKGAIPGAEGSWVEVRDAVKKARHPDAPEAGSYRAPSATPAAAPADAPAIAGGPADTIVLVDGIGPKAEEQLKEKGLGTLTAFVEADPGERDAVLEELGVKEKADNEAWVQQAEDILAGGEPRAQVDRDLLRTLLGEGGS